MPSFATILSALLIGLMPAVALAADASAGFTGDQKKAIEEIVKDYIVNKEPEIIIQAAQSVQAKQETENAEKAQKALRQNKDKVFNDPNSPVGGNPKGDVTVVEFYDYQCGYCKMALGAKSKLLAEDKNVRFVYKEYPILGPNSKQAAKAALASVKQGKFAKFHEELMKTKDRLSDEVIFKAATNAGLDADRLKKDMEDSSIEAMLQNNIKLGSEIGAHGTPTFIIGEQFFPGAMPYEALKKAVDDARKAPKK